ncbi:MAG: DUF4395 domain-containing protein [Chloroflexota bacterium]
MVKKVDTTAIKFNQASIITFTLLAYVLDLPWLVLFVGAVLAVGTIWPGAALFQQAYRQVLKPLGLVKPHVIDDDPAPHRFAQGVGATFLGLSSLALLALNAISLGWGLAGLVVVLAAINLFFNFCAGCFVYYQLRRLGLIRRSESAL